MGKASCGPAGPGAKGAVSRLAMRGEVGSSGGLEMDETASLERDMGGRSEAGHGVLFENKRRRQGKKQHRLHQAASTMAAWSRLSASPGEMETGMPNSDQLH